MEEDTVPTTTTTRMRGQELDDQEESVRIAVKALGDMRNMSMNMNTSARSRAPSYSQSHSHSPSHNTKLPPIILPPLSISTSPSTSNKNENHNSFFASSLASTSASSSSTSTSTSTSTLTSAAAPAASSSPPPTSSGALEPLPPPSASASPAFVSRMSHFPLVGSALRAYEQGKASSRVVKYGAEMVESSVKSISRPVIERLPVNVNTLDEFACRQLDRLDRYRRPSNSGELPTSPADASPSANTSTGVTATANANVPSPADRDRGRPKLRSKTLDGSAVVDDDDVGGEMLVFERDRHGRERDRDRERERERGGGGRSVPKWLEATSPFVAPPPPPPDAAPYGYPSTRAYSRGSTPTRDAAAAPRSSSSSNAHAITTTTTTTTTNGNPNANGNYSATESGSERQVAQRSRWQAMLLEAGGLSAALSEESMRRLKYCLQWLQYATAHIDAQILILRDFTASLQASASPSSLPPARPPISEEHMRKLTDVRRDIVHTIRQVVDVVSKYAGGALPEPARGRVRGFILKLPQRWASRAGGPGSESAGMGMGEGEREREREVVAAAAGTGTGVVRRAGGQRRAAHRERGVDSGASASAAGASGLRSGASSTAVSPSSSPRVGRAVLGGGERGERGGGAQTVSPTAALVASQRILTLATESLDMMRNVTGVVKDSLDRADAWVGRLRTVGIQRTAQDGDTDADLELETESSVVPSDSATAASSRERERDFDFAFSDRLRYRHAQLPSSPSYTHGHGHSRKGSAQSDSVQSSSADMEMEMDVDADRERERDRDRDSRRSPFFSAASSTAWGSSIPSTPAHLSGSGSGGLSRNGSALSVHSPSASVSGLPVGVGAMSLGSRYGTPKSAVVELPGEVDERDRERERERERDREGGDVLRDLKGDLKGGARYADVRIVDADREVDREAKVFALREEQEEGMEVDG